MKNVIKKIDDAILFCQKQIAAGKNKEATYTYFVDKLLLIKQECK